jgi:hypothetical protein
VIAAAALVLIGGCAPAEPKPDLFEAIGDHVRAEFEQPAP